MPMLRGDDILGVIEIKKSQPGKYNAAIDAFRKAAELPGDTDDHKEVVDLAWMAIGRLFYEMDELDQAVLEREPMLRQEGLRGGARYFDAATDDARLTSPPQRGRAGPDRPARTVHRAYVENPMKMLC